VLDELPPAGVVPTSAAVTPVATSQFTAATVPPVAAATTTQVSDATADADTDSDSVIEQLRYIQQNFTYEANTTIDIRDSVWAGKDVYQLFGDDSVMAAGGSVAAGDDVEDVRVDHSIEDSYNIDDSFNPENSGNTQTGTGNVNGHGAELDLENSGNEVDDSTGVVFGEDNETGDSVSGVGNVVGNEVDVEVRDSGNDNSDNYDDSFNETDTELEFEIDESFNEETNDTEVNTDITNIEDNVVVADNTLDASTNVADSGNSNTEVSDFLNDATVAVDESIAARETEVDF
jgi:hypothetical protein